MIFLGPLLGAIIGGAIEASINRTRTSAEELIDRTVKYGPDNRYTLKLDFACEDMKESILILKSYRRYFEEEFESVCVLIEALGVLYTKREKALQVAAENISSVSTAMSKPLKVRELYPSEVVSKALSISVLINSKTNTLLRAFVSKVKHNPQDKHHDNIREHAKVIFDANNTIEQCLSELISELRHAMGI